jgi:hypothetical protein
MPLNKEGRTRVRSRLSFTSVYGIPRPLFLANNRVDTFLPNTRVSSDRSGHNNLHARFFQFLEDTKPFLSPNARPVGALPYGVVGEDNRRVVCNGDERAGGLQAGQQPLNRLLHLPIYDVVWSRPRH